MEYISDVWNLSHLRLVVRNLCAEILDRLAEEKRRHKRVAKQVRLGFTQEDENGEKESGNTFLDVTPGIKSSDLSEGVMSFILDYPHFDRQKFRIIELKFAINEFEPM